MNATAPTPFWSRYRNTQEHMRQTKALLQALRGDLEAIARMTGEPTLIEEDFARLVERMDELSDYAHEIRDSIQRKREDGAEADARLDAMIENRHDHLLRGSSASYRSPRRGALGAAAYGTSPRRPANRGRARKDPMGPRSGSDRIVTDARLRRIRARPQTARGDRRGDPQARANELAGSRER
jgi:Tfp pilus assembly protein FimV